MASQGTYGLVFRAQDKVTGEEVALKQIKFDARHTSKVGFPITALRETNILLALNHPNIVRVKEMVVGSSVDKVHGQVLLSLCNSMSMFLSV
mgnify:CR=1 FL=1